MTEFEDCDLQKDECAPAWKPDVPYKEGFTFLAFRHQPPQPLGLGYDTEPPPDSGKWKDLSQLEYCLSYQPLACQTDLSSCRSMTITSVIRTGQDRGAQIVIIGNALVAKIYDPLHYPSEDEYGTKKDVLLDADTDYSSEAAAFAEIQLSPEAKSVTPPYHGTWTTTIQTKVEPSQHNALEVSRPVRFILMDHCKGICMDDIDAYELCEEMRSMILKKTIVAETLLYDAGIHHRDVCPRNVMIEGFIHNKYKAKVDDSRVRVKLIDFNIACVPTHPAYCGWDLPREPKWPLKLRSPIIRYFGHMREFSTTGWCDDEDMKPEKWLWEHFRDDDQYIPVSWNPNDPWVRPVRVQVPEGLHSADPSKVPSPADYAHKKQNSSPRGSESSEDRAETLSSESESVSDGQKQTWPAE